MPVLPPTEESTCASSVVGICTKRMPRRTMLAAKPARSPITPPPSAITQSPRSSPISSRRSHSRGQRREALGRLAGRQDLRAGVAARGLQARLQRGQVARGDVLVGDDAASARRRAAASMSSPARAAAGRARSARRRSGAERDADRSSAAPVLASVASALRVSGSDGSGCAVRPARRRASSGLCASASMISPTMVSCGTSRLSTVMSAVA